MIRARESRGRRHAKYGKRRCAGSGRRPRAHPAAAPPPITDADGRLAPADVEFGFVKGELRLFQIRPLLESAQARSDAYFAALDAGMTDLAAKTVRLDQTPGD